MARSMMTERNSSDVLAKVMSTTVYLQNKCFTTSESSKIPFKAFIGRKSGIKYLKVFGCLCYTYVPTSLRQKFDGKVEKGLFMGYGSCEKKL